MMCQAPVVSGIPSKRRKGHLVFHCPRCTDDRVGRVEANRDVRCVACSAIVSDCAMGRGPVGTSFGHRINAATRSLFAALVAESVDRPAATSLALDLSGRFCIWDWEPADLVERANAAPDLRERLLVGDLLIVAEDLEAPGRADLLTCADRIALVAGPPTRRQSDVLRKAGRLLR